MDLIVFIEQHWTLLTGVIGFIVGYVRIQMGLSQLKKENQGMRAEFLEVQKTNEARFAETEKEIKVMNPIWQEIRERLARIETSLSIHFKDK